MSVNRRSEKRVVITGMGMVSPLGNDVESSWTALLAGTSGIGAITLFDAEEFPVRFAAEVSEFDLALYMDRKEARRFDRFSTFGVAAAEQAVSESGVKDSVSPERFGVIVGSGVGGIRTLEDNVQALITKGPRRVSPFFIPMFIPDIVAGLISIRHGAKGANYATVSACASSAHAIGDAYRIIQRGDADAMIAGGTEAAISPIAVAGFASMRALSTRNDDPATASRPFDATRDGFVVGEGAGCLVLEGLEHARERGAPILAEIVGYGASADAYHITSPAPDGAGATAAMRMALAEAGAAPEEVGYINAHGTSTQQNDRAETGAIKSVFGDHAYEMIVGSTKSMTGHLLGAAGGLEAVVCTKVLQEGRIPPTMNFTEADPDCDLDYAHNRSVERAVHLTLSNSFGFGGHNVTLAIKKWGDE